MTMVEGNPIMWPQVPPGTYHLVAFDKSHEMNLDDAREMAKWTSLGQLVKVSPGGTATVQVDVIRSADLGVAE
jgi:hypothetical protein